MANDLFRERVTLRGEEGEPRTITLVELREELAALGLPFPTPSGPPPRNAAPDEEHHHHDDDAEMVPSELVAVSEPEEQRAAPETAASKPADAESPEQRDRRRGRRRGRRGGRRGRHGNDKTGGQQPPSTPQS